MIHFNFVVYNPNINSKFRSIFQFDGPLTKNKSWEIEIENTEALLGLEFDLTFKRDHAGIKLHFSLFNYALLINIYDNRHWDSVKNKWIDYEKRT